MLRVTEYFASHSSSLKVIKNGTIRNFRYTVSYSHSIATMAASLAVSTQYTNVTDSFYALLFHCIIPLIQFNVYCKQHLYMFITRIVYYALALEGVAGVKYACRRIERTKKKFAYSVHRC